MTHPGPAQFLAEVLRAGVSTAGGAPLPVRRAWPRDLTDPTAGHVLELAGPTGAVGAVLRPDGGVDVVLDDPRLPCLAPLRSDHRVLAHRPAKRAVLRAPDGDFVKLARPTATRTAIDRLASVDLLLDGMPGAPHRPRITVARPEEGVLVLASCAGRSISEVALDPDGSPADLARIGGDMATALLTLAACRPDPAGADGLPHHDASDEARVLRRWLDAALEAAPLRGEERRRVETEGAAVVDELAALGEPDVAVLAHRDLHDGQILVEPRVGGLSVLDWDTAAWADPGLDVANLLAHLDRLALLHPGRATAVQALGAAVKAGLVAGGHPALADDRARARTALYRRGTALRLVAVHAFRPRASAGPSDSVASPDRPHGPGLAS